MQMSILVLFSSHTNSQTYLVLIFQNIKSCVGEKEKEKKLCGLSFLWGSISTSLSKRIGWKIQVWFQQWLQRCRLKRKQFPVFARAMNIGINMTWLHHGSKIEDRNQWMLANIGNTKSFLLPCSNLPDCVKLLLFLTSASVPALNVWYRWKYGSSQ